jgi:hypothetical protein
MKTFLRTYKKTEEMTTEQFKSVGSPLTDFLRKIEDKSGSEWRRLIIGSAVKINDFKITNPEARYVTETTADGDFILHILE